MKAYERSSTRTKTDAPANLEVGRRVYPASLTNISTGGAMMKCSSPVAKGAQLKLHVYMKKSSDTRIISIPGTARWTAAGYVGVSFTT